MCQAKSLGGKRCAIHHHGTQAAIQTTVVKTGVDTPIVKEVFSNLNKEGKNLPEPSRLDYEAYLEKERFLTEIDSTIPERDKRMILKKLEKAKEENTPSGGTFHAWKNLFSTTMQKFGKKTRLVIAGFTVAAVAFGAAGCAPTTQASVITNGTSISIIAGEQVTDALGTYSRLTVDPNSPEFSKTAIGKTYMDEIYAAGYTDADFSAAQKSAVTFALTEMIDSKGLDTPEALSDSVSGYLSGSFVPHMTNPSESAVVYLQKDGLTFIRDGKPRIASNSTKIISAMGVSYDKTRTSINFYGQSETKYRATPESLVKWYQTTHTGVSEADVKNALKITDSKEKNITVISSWTLAMLPDETGAWKVQGYENTYQTLLP